MHCQSASSPGQVKWSLTPLPMECQSTSNKMPIDYQLTVDWYPIGCQLRFKQMPIEIQLEANWDPIEIQSDANRDPIGFQLRSNQMPIEIQSDANWDLIGCQLRSNHMHIDIQSVANSICKKLGQLAPPKGKQTNLIVNLIPASLIPIECQSCPLGGASCPNLVLQEVGTPGPP